MQTRTCRCKPHPLLQYARNVWKDMPEESQGPYRDFRVFRAALHKGVSDITPPGVVVLTQKAWTRTLEVSA